MNRACFRVDGHRAFEQDFRAARDVEPAFAVIGAALELADGVARRRFGPFDDFRRQIVDIVEIMTVAQQLEAFRADLAG